MKRVLISICFGLIFVCGGVLATEAFKIIELHHRLAQDVLPVIQPLVGENGVVTGMNNQLIIRADSERMPEIERAIAALDQARKNLTITVSHDQSTQASNRRIDAEGNVRIGEVSVSNTRKRYPSNTARVVVDGSDTRLKQGGQQFITVLDGQYAFIRVGQMIPYTQDWVVLTRCYVRVMQITEYVNISTGFVVRPSVLGNGQIELEIMPRISKLNASGYVDFESLKTIVRVDSGAWFDLGATMQSRDEVSGKILGYEEYNAHNASNLRIKVE